MSVNLLVLILYTQVTLIPILGLLFLGLRQERRHNERLLKESLRALRIVGISRGSN